MAWHNNLAIHFSEVSAFHSINLTVESNFQNKTKSLVYVQKDKLTYCIIVAGVTCQGLLK